MGKKKRKEKDDSDEPVTYINERNKVFNKKVARYYDKYTTEYVHVLFGTFSGLSFIPRSVLPLTIQDPSQFRAWNSPLVDIMA